MTVKLSVQHLGGSSRNTQSREEEGLRSESLSVIGLTEYAHWVDEQHPGGMSCYCIKKGYRQSLDYDENKYQGNSIALTRKGWAL